MASRWFTRELGHEAGPVSAQSLCTRRDIDIEVRREGSAIWTPYFDALEQLKQDAQQDAQQERESATRRQASLRKHDQNIQIMKEARQAFYSATEGGRHGASAGSATEVLASECSDSAMARAQQALHALQALLASLELQRASQDALPRWLDRHLNDHSERLRVIQRDLERQIELQKLYIRFASRLALPAVALRLFEELATASVSWGSATDEQLARVYERAVDLEAAGRSFTIQVHPQVGETVTSMKPDWSAAHGDHGTYEEVTEFVVTSPQRIEIL